MTDVETLRVFRFQQALETLNDAQRLLNQEVSLRSAVNRAYYSMFYAILGLLLSTDIHIKTSKHIGIISLFDREFIHTNKIEKRFSAQLHEAFKAVLENKLRCSTAKPSFPQGLQPASGIGRRV